MPDTSLERVATTPMELMQLAINKEGNIDVAVLERLVDLQMRFTDREDKIAFRSAMTTFKENMPTIIRQRSIKDKEGAEKYKAVALEDVAGPVMKALVELGITYRFKSADLPDGRTRVSCILGMRGTAYEEEGSTLAAAPDTSGGKDALKAVGSTVSYLEKYTLLASIGMHVYGTDPEAVPVEGVTQGEASEYIEAIRGGETPVKVMAAWTTAIEEAKKFTPVDYKAMTIFTEARDERLKALRSGK